MRYEAMAFGGGVDDHPYILTSELIRDSISQFQMLADIDFIEAENRLNAMVYDDLVKSSGNFITL